MGDVPKGFPVTPGNFGRSRLITNVKGLFKYLTEDDIMDKTRELTIDYKVLNSQFKAPLNMNLQYKAQSKY